MSELGIPVLWVYWHTWMMPCFNCSTVSMTEIGFTKFKVKGQSNKLLIVSQSPLMLFLCVA